MTDHEPSSHPGRPVETLHEAVAARELLLDSTADRLQAIQREIDDLAYELYDIADEDRAAIEAMLGQGSDEAASEGDDEDAEDAPAADAYKLASELIDYCVGCVFGRWDIRCATGKKPEPPEPDPFDPLPVCAPGMLQNDQGLPAAPADVAADYPLSIAWSGILVDDPNHPDDIKTRAADALRIIWANHPSDVEQEACGLLDVKDLRDHLRKSAKFFDDHLKRCSKSRRKAPLYWPLSTPSGSYTLWLYYHRLTDQTLFTCVNDFVDPKIERVGEDLARLRAQDGRSRSEDKELEQLSDLEGELKTFREELLRLAAFWKPNLNDGVQISAAPLHSLFPHKPWQKTLLKTWKALEDGKYDWAHLAMWIWPERVVPACHRDRSFAIAHGLESELWYKLSDDENWVTTKSGKRKKNTKEVWKPRDRSEADLDALVSNMKARRYSASEVTT